MSQQHQGNMIPEITFEEHDGINNAKRVNVVAGGVGLATVTLVSTPTLFAVVNTAAAGDVAAVVIGTWSTGLAYGCLTLAFIPQPVAVITGTFVPSATEAEVVTGGDTSIITLTDENWIAAGVGSFDLQRQNIINGHNSAQSEALGWNLVPRATQNITGVVRTSATVVTTMWDASPTYDITATETITVTVPASSVVGNTTIVATPTFQVIATGAAGAETPKGFMTPNFFWGS